MKSRQFNICGGNMENSVLFVNACARKESRTRILAEKLISRLDMPCEEICLADFLFPAVNEDYLQKRDQLIAAGDFHHSMFDFARRFSEADTIVIAAPYWDLSFPATVKQYLELVNVVGITFKYSAEGIPVGLCKAGRLFYVSTAGGTYVPDTFGFGYVKALAENYYGIQDVRKIEAVGLDIDGADANAIMADAIAALAEMELD